MFGASGNPYRFRLTSFRIDILMLDRFCSPGSQAEPATRHQVNLLFRRNIGRGSGEPREVLMFFDSALDLPSHAFGIAHLKLEDNIVMPATFWFFPNFCSTIVMPATLCIVKGTTLSTRRRPVIVMPATILSSLHRPYIDRAATETPFKGALCLDLRLLKPYLNFFL
ncbi:MAG: hypothetical protein KDN18_01540 [Verrucomicrobiae bacterium]|nr:hypothetical protein [Verrucomicrobiae bacterium]